MAVSIDVDALARFLVEAKRRTYASQEGKVTSPRQGAKDLAYQRGGYSYRDSYFGELDSSGQEVVYQNDLPIWGMNYYGRMLVTEVPRGFIELLRLALMSVEVSAPFRGCRVLSRGRYMYRCHSEGDVLSFSGKETIEYYNKEGIHESTSPPGLLFPFSSQRAGR